MKTIGLILLLTIQSLACDFSKVKKMEGGYFIPQDCYIRWGELEEKTDLQGKEIKHLKKTIELKDLALQYSEKRVRLFEEVAYKNTERLNAINNLAERNQWISFAIGFAASSVTIYIASKTLR